MDPSKKRALRENNLKVWAGATDIFPVKQNQDSSLKKNTAFIKRLRTAISAPNVSLFLTEVAGLSLYKYMAEIISSLYEGLQKLKTPADIAASVQVVSALHQRFGPAEFTGYLGWYIGRGLSTPDKSQLKALAPDVKEREEKDRLARQRGLLRVATELWLAGVLRSLEDVVRPESETKDKDGGKASEPTAKAKAAANAAKSQTGESDPFPLEVLKDLLGHDRDHVNLPLVVIFVKSFAWDVLGIVPRGSDRRPGADDHDDVKIEGSSEPDASTKEPPLASPELAIRFKNVLARYFEDVKAHIVRDQKTLTAQNRRNAEAYVRSGEIFDDRQANFEKQTKAQDKLISNAQVLADMLGEDMPDLRDKDEGPTVGENSIGLVKAGDYLKGQNDGPGIWEDEEERRFYENLIDVKDRVPTILLEDGKKKKQENEDPAGKKQDSKSPVEESTSAPTSTDVEDLNVAIANKSVGAQVDGLLARLPDLHGKDSVDQFAIDFCFVNSKASRNRLVKALLDVPKGRVDLLPLYSRITAILSKYMPDISSAMITHLDDEFRSLQRRKSKDFLGAVRLQNIRYFAELTKFGIVPEHVIFHCFKVCLDDLTRMNIEILGQLMENCGRFLLRSQDTSPRMTSFLETLQRKKGAQHLDPREKLIIENAIYHVNPPERPAIEQKERTPMELFIQKIIYDDLTKRNVDKVTKQIRKLHWEEQEVVSILEKVFTRPWKVRYNNIHLLAVILGSIHRYHPQFAITCVDDLLETIFEGLEKNDVKFNQRRIAQGKYLGELYAYRMIDSSVVFDTLFKIIAFGHENGIPKTDFENPWDLPTDFFRIRLVCTLLETCASFFAQGPAKKKLDFFVSFFQYYINTKDKLSPDIEFAIQDAFAVISPDLKLIDSFEEAGKEFSDACKENYQTTENGKVTAEVEDLDDESVSDEVDDDDDAVADDAEKSSADELEVPDQADDSDDSNSSEEEDEQIIVTRQEEERDPEVDADFDRELAKLMADSMDSRKLERKTLFDVPLPIRRKEREAAGEEPQFTPGPFPDAPHMKFSLLSKRGNKQLTRDIDLPADSTFAVAMRSQQQAQKLEQKRIKDIVLNLDLRDDSTEATDGTSLEKNPPNPYLQPRVDKAGKGRANARGRQLQVSDLDWT
ncbi:putative nonsense-mediated mRNA decay factor [Microthyrium microscopicum]|uniref:Putative nonsense-mediated mRNA decay factor n=1 Tax=Microthyrium microscopicum TaxID=703497 RepID=A0A6A6UA64_9PEZI|nr:putative nonsense-mediated mRNA decay factor [Microthyrium microscopicum]